MASVLLGSLVPLGVYWGSWLHHRWSFTGTCGPRAPDIAAHPCDFATYAAQWDAGFAGVGLFLMLGASIPLGVALAGLVFAILLPRPSVDANQGHTA